MNKRYKISQVAEIFNISRQTLIYYDKINLFKPEHIDSENSYRYYLGDQLFQLEFIILLKKAGFTLNDIKNYIKTKTPEESLDYLEKRNLDIKNKIKALKETQKTINKKIKQLKKINSVVSKVKVVDLEEIRIYLKPVPKPFSYTKFNKVILDIEKLKVEKKIKGEKLIEVPDYSLKTVNYEGGVESLGFEIPKKHPYIQGEILIPKGKFLHITHNESWEDIEKNYKKLYDYCEKNNYKVRGKLMETFTNVIVYLGTGGGAVVEIYLPIENK